jgi:Pyruvate/2-oxoacid:ferredoxin oxidoreductase gamma subunit
VVWGVGTLNWVGVRKEVRGRGVTTALIETALKTFQRERCFKADLFVYPRKRRLIRFLEGLGFERRAYLDRTLLGTSVVYMAKKLRKTTPKETTRRIVISGRAGQGIKLVAQVLAKILARLGKEVSLRVEYGPSVRSGKVEAELVYSEDKIDVPLVDQAHVLVVLATPEDRLPKARWLIREQTVSGLEEKGGNGSRRLEEALGFAKISQTAFGNYRFVSMVALGHLLRVIGVNIEKVNFEAALPSRFVQENVRAIQQGFALRHDH